MNRIKQEPEEEEKEKEETSISPQKDTNVKNNDDDNQNTHQRDDPNTKRKCIPFEERVQQLKKFKEQYGHCSVSVTYDMSLYQWCRNIKLLHRKLQETQVQGNDRLTPKRIKELEDLGFDFTMKRGKYANLSSPVNKSTILKSDDENDDSDFEEDEANDDDSSDEDSSNNNDSEDMIQIQSFNDRIKALKTFKEKYGHLDVPKKYDHSLYSWSSLMRSGYKHMQKGKPSKYRLTHERFQVLKDLGFDFRGLTDRKESSVEVSTPSSMHGTSQKKRGMDTMKVPLRKDITSFEVKSQGGKRTLSNSTYSIETRTSKRTKSEPVAKSNVTMRSVRPGSPAFDLARYTYEELLQQALENKAMCQRMETNAKVRHEKSLEEIDSCIFNSDDEDSSKRKFECRFCGLKFDFQCVCILHMPKCKERKFGDPILIKRCES